MTLEIKGLCASYSHMPVLDNVSLKLEDGESVALIGANGAGKSSLMRTVMRLPQPGAPKLAFGEILLNGKLINDMPTHKIVRQAGMSLCPEGRHVFGNLSVLENLLLAAPGQGENDLETVFECFPRLAERQKQRAHTLSGGEQQMLAVARALMTRCKVLLLDEPSMGLAPLLVENLFETLNRLNRQGLSILLVEQNAALALRTAGRAYLMETGRIVLSGPAAELASNPLVRKAYLG